MLAAYFPVALCYVKVLVVMAIRICNVWVVFNNYYCIMSPSQFFTETMPMHRYHFNLYGTVKEINLPGNKAIITFKLNGREERALLLGKSLEEVIKPHQSIGDIFKINETIHFDCHIYDNVRGAGKDRCNFFVMKAWKQSDHESRGSCGGSLACKQMSSSRDCKTDIGWLSEVCANSGVITFTSGVSGVDQRVSFAANRVYFYEKRTSPGVYLPSILKLGDTLNFEAIPAVDYVESILADDFCAFVALLVWKGKRPQVDMGSLLDNSSATATAIEQSSWTRKDSLESSSSSDMNTDQDVMSNSFSSFLILPSAGNPTGLHRGVGMIAKLVSESTGVVWWVNKANHFESVWFHRNKVFKYGYNLHNKRLDECLKEGDAVHLIVEKAPPDCGAKWSAKQILVTDESTSELRQLCKPNEK